MRKITILVLLTVLFTTSLFSQQQIWDTTFVTSLRSNKEYTKGFYVMNYNPKVLKQCIIDAINLARKQNKELRGDALSFNEILESAAQNQADYMAMDEIKTTEGMGKFRTTADRVISFGGTQFVDEIVNKVKATKGTEAYSYLDVTLDFLLPILNHPKKSQTILKRKWAFSGIGFAFDKNNKNMYISVVFGNSKSLNPAATRGAELTVPFTKKKYGLKAYDERACKKCDQAKNLEELQKCLVVKNGFIYFEHKDFKQLKKLIGKSKDGLAIDIVFRDQFKCGDDNIVDNNRVNRGYMTKRIFINKILSKNEIEDKKSTALSVPLAELPPEITGDYELNLLIIKEKSVCRAVQPIYIEKNPSQYVEKLTFHPDTTSIKCPVYKPTSENGVLTFSIPFALNKSTYNPEDIEPFIKALNEPQFIINQLTITAYTSMEGGDKDNIELQNKRAESIINALKRRQKANLSNKIITSDSWELFKKDVLATKYPELASLTQEEVKSRLKGKVVKDLEPMLAKHRFASIVMDITYDISGSYEQPFVISKFNKLIEKGDFVNAFAVQKYIVQAVKDGRYNSKTAAGMKIPGNDKRYLPFWLNYYFVQNYFRDINNDMLKGVAPLSALDPANEYAYFDKMICDVMNTEITNETIMRDLQGNVDKAYSSKGIDKKNIDNLNLELQFKILEFADTSVSQAMLTAAEQTYERIKQIALGLDQVTWQNSYKLAGIFINHGDYPYAIKLMDPYIDSPSITTDFMFTYFSLLSHREDFYLTPSFAIIAKRCLEADKARFCTLMGKFSFQVLENGEVKKIFCKECK